MIVNFYGCRSCGKIFEEQILIQRTTCGCGSGRFSPTYLGPLALTWYIVKHPSYFIRALRGE